MPQSPCRLQKRSTSTFWKAKKRDTGWNWTKSTCKFLFHELWDANLINSETELRLVSCNIECQSFAFVESLSQSPHPLITIFPSVVVCVLHSNAWSPLLQILWRGHNWSDRSCIDLASLFQQVSLNLWSNQASCSLNFKTVRKVGPQVQNGTLPFHRWAEKMEWYHSSWQQANSSRKPIWQHSAWVVNLSFIVLLPFTCSVSFHSLRDNRCHEHQTAGL